MSGEIATPILAFGCALIVFLIFVVLLVIDHVIRYQKMINRKRKVKIQGEPITLYSSPEIQSDWTSDPTLINNMNYGVVVNHVPPEKETPTVEDKKADEDMMVRPPHIGELLQSRLNEVEAQDYENASNEEPLDYAYEGQENERMENGDLSSGTSLHSI
uniref:Uncharacterized protein n=1 Tax=Trichobilharzia regenti TaxID=157069 RepID=A0AA85JK31_TRIRE|nr:unnamed protein product [Trichobilharzia regenti]